MTQTVSTTTIPTTQAKQENLPLTGVTVVALEHAVAVPIATRQLADLGARVIKVERIDGGDFARGYDAAVAGEMSSVFLWTGRGKESLALDLKSPEGRQIMLELLASADVFMQNMSPGAVERLGLGADELTHRNPRLIVVSNSGYGTPGPYAGKRAYDALVQAESGAVAVTGTKDLMVKPGFSAADVASGMYMTSAAMMGLFQRERTGSGTVVDVAMIDAMTDFIANHIYYAQHHGSPAERISLGHPSLVPYGEYATQDTPVVIGIQNDREWARFAEHVMGRRELVCDPRYATNVARARRRDEVDALVADTCRRFTAGELTELLDQIGIACARVNDLAVVAEHPQLVERGRWVETPTPVGPVPTLRQVITERGKEYPVRPVPALGQHSRQLLAELGHDEKKIDDFLRRGIVATADADVFAGASAPAGDR
ncbi:MULTISPECIES: CaiB/BaiF CoA transferase family protein [unclassified Rhodococcus (in: high G+C Gram-positive bacteria)]|jgi:crotonobetainyl-CoA:carnitine CoA-transferase CaiB-like acyl-CoA transferase|uniref:CaiB/BaiF CoA transferase family protein n=1 Tax=unclassified Rhodococcus (in: high G+C Gram-positive bacteria) TaxID=192944 RepID=UPI0002F504EA|nr:CaiB/BaiF CoA-transferase family protein [Rhodococcus sp. DK17]